MSQEELERYFSRTENIAGVIAYLREKVGEDSALNEANRVLGGEEEYWKRKYELMSVKGLLAVLRKVEQKTNN